MFKTKNIQVKQFLKNRNLFIIFHNREIIFSRDVSRLFFPHYIVLFVILCDGWFFTAEKKGKKGTCPITSYSRFWAVFILACKTGALWAKLGERRILGEARDEGRRKIKRLLPVHCSGCYYAGYVYIKGRIACKLLNALFYCGKSTKVYCYCVLFALV